jgi:uncharacterized repeat protein (TIGR01451 family)
LIDADRVVGTPEWSELKTAICSRQAGLLVRAATKRSHMRPSASFAFALPLPMRSAWIAVSLAAVLMISGDLAAQTSTTSAAGITTAAAVITPAVMLPGFGVGKTVALDPGLAAFEIRAITGVGPNTITVAAGTKAHAPGFVISVCATVTPSISGDTNGTGTQDQACSEQPLTLHANGSDATSFQWYESGNLLAGETNATYVATTAGNISVTGTSACGATPSSATYVVQNPTPHAPLITARSSTALCTGGSVILDSNSVTGIQWYKDGSPIPAANAQSYTATQAGTYTAQLGAIGCHSQFGNNVVVTLTASPNAAVAAPAAVMTGTSGNVASVADAGVGATYNWSITNGTITGGTGTSSVTFTAGAVGTLTLQVRVTNAGGCADTKSANVTVAPPPPVTVTSVLPATGTPFGGTAVTIQGTGFLTGATVTIGALAPTNVVVVNSTTITANTAAHAVGAVNVTVTNTNTATDTLSSGFTYKSQFDSTGDGTIDPSDVFFLIAYLYQQGPAPHGSAGILSGDANGDGVVNPADIFYLVNFLFLSGPQPAAIPAPRTVSASRLRAPNVAAPADVVTIGAGTQTGFTVDVPVYIRDSALTPLGIDQPAGSRIQSYSLAVNYSPSASVQSVTFTRAGVTTALTPAFESTPTAAGSISLVDVFQESTNLIPFTSNAAAPGNQVAHLVFTFAPSTSIATINLTLDATLTLLSNQAGTVSETVPLASLSLVNSQFTFAASADIGITKSAAGGPNYFATQAATYNLAVTNSGPGAANAVVVTDALPAGATLISAIPSQGTCSGTTTVTCSMGSMASAGTASIAVQVTLNTAGPLSNTATVSAAPQPDANAANNSSTASITVQAASAIPALSPLLLLMLALGVALVGLIRLLR